MGVYVPINGHPTWIARTGHGPPLLLLHGGFTNSDGLLDVFARLGDEYELVAFDRRGHGRTADTDAPFHYADMAGEAVGVLEHIGRGAADVIGYSDGGIVAVLLALARPELVRSLVLIGANYRYDGLVPGVFDDLGPESETAEFLGPNYAERSPDGAEHWPVVLAKGDNMIHTEPTLTTDDLGRITAPVLVLVGDDDAILPAHTQSLYEALPKSQLAVIPGASHIAPYEKPALVFELVNDFLRSGGEVNTMMPIRRHLA